MSLQSNENKKKIVSLSKKIERLESRSFCYLVCILYISLVLVIHTVWLFSLNVRLVKINENVEEVRVEESNSVPSVVD